MRVFVSCLEMCVARWVSVASLLAVLLSPGMLVGQQQDLERVVLQLRWEYEFQFAGFIAATELGYYAEAGLDVELRELNFGGSVYEELTSGRAQYAVGTTDALVARANGTPVVALAAIFQHSPFIMLSRSDAEIRTPADLVGRTVSTYGIRNTILEAMLQSEGVDPDGIEFTRYDQDYSRIASGEVVATGAVLTLQPHVFDELGIQYSIMYPQTYGIDFYGNTLLTLEDEIREHPDRVRAFREASLRGWRYAMENPEEIIEIFLEGYSPHIDRALLEYEAEVMVELIEPAIINIGHMNPGRWRHINDAYRRLGIVETDIALEEFLYDPFPEQDNTALWRLIGVLSAIAFLVSTIAIALITLNVRLRRAQAEKQEKIKELEAAISEIKTLRDMLPICASCKKIRDDEGYWEHVETYLTRHTSTVFSHGLCPTCVEKLYPDVKLDGITGTGGDRTQGPSKSDV